MTALIRRLNQCWLVVPAEWPGNLGHSVLLRLPIVGDRGRSRSVAYSDGKLPVILTESGNTLFSLEIVFLAGCASALQNIPVNTGSAAPYRNLSCEVHAPECLCARDSLSEYETGQRGERVWDGVLNVLVFRSLGPSRLGTLIRLPSTRVASRRSSESTTVDALTVE